MNLPLSMVVAGLLALVAHAQTPAPQSAEPTGAGKPKQEIEVAAPRPVASTNQISTNAIPDKVKEPKEPVVTYSGVANDLRKSTNRFKIFSLRRPANLKEDEANLVRGLRTEGGPAVKIFSVDF